MLVIRQSFFFIHVVINQFPACLFQSGCFGIRADDTGFEIFNPFFEGSDGYFIEFVHPDQEVFGEDFGRQFPYDGVLLFSGHFKEVACMYPHESVLPVIQVVVSPSDVEIEYADGVHLLHLRVEFSQFDMLCDGLCHSEEDSLQIIDFAGVLHLYDDDFVFAVPGLDVHAVEFLVFALLVSFTFQYLYDAYRFVQQHCEETLQHAEVGFIAQQPFHRPVKSDISVCIIHYRTSSLYSYPANIAFKRDDSKLEPV